MSNHPSNQPDKDSNKDLFAAQSAFEQFLLSSPYVNTSQSDNSVRMKNTFIEVAETDDFVSGMGYRSSTCPADISDEIFQLARTITRDLPLMATIVEGLENGTYNYGSIMQDRVLNHSQC